MADLKGFRLRRSLGDIGSRGVFLAGFVRSSEIILRGPLNIIQLGLFADRKRLLRKITDFPRHRVGMASRLRPG